MPRLGGVLALLAGGAGGLGAQLGEERERARVAKLDAERRQAAEQARTDRLAEQRRELLLTPGVREASKPLDAGRAVQLLGGWTPGGMGTLAGAAEVAPEFGSLRERTLGDDPVTKGLVFDASQSAPAVARRDKLVDTHRARLTKAEDDAAAQLAENKRKYGAVAQLFGAKRVGAFNEGTDYGGVGAQLGKREADAADLARTRLSTEAALAAARARGGENGVSPAMRKDLLGKYEKLRNLELMLDDYEKDLDASEGVTLAPAVRDAARSRLEAKHRALQFGLKELNNLGVLNGPDLELLNEQLSPPSGWGPFRRGTEGVKAQIGAVRGTLSSQRQTLREVYGFNDPSAGGQGGSSTGSAGGKGNPISDPADLWQELRARGMTPAQATAEVHRILGRR